MNPQALRDLAAEWRRLRDAATEGKWATGGPSPHAHLCYVDGPPETCPRIADLGNGRDSLGNMNFITHAANTPIAETLEKVAAELERLRATVESLTFGKSNLQGLAQWDALGNGPLRLESRSLTPVQIEEQLTALNQRLRRVE